jgi:hypothetical protein
VARQIAKELARCGAEAFLDEAEIGVGQDFEQELLDHLEEADEMVVLMTPWALERPYVLAELGAAWLRKIPIVVLLQGMTPDELQAKPEVPVFLKKRKMMELNGIDVYLAELRRRVQE